MLTSAATYRYSFASFVHDSHDSYTNLHCPYLGELPRCTIGSHCNLVGGTGAAESIERILWERIELDADLRDVAVDNDHL